MFFGTYMNDMASLFHMLHVDGVMAEVTPNFGIAITEEALTEPPETTARIVNVVD